MDMTLQSADIRKIKKDIRDAIISAGSEKKTLSEWSGKWTQQYLFMYIYIF